LFHSFTATVLSLDWRHQDNALTELYIVCSLSSGRIVANPDITLVLGATSGWPVIQEEHHKRRLYRVALRFQSRSSYFEQISVVRPKWLHECLLQEPV
jgi:hypothetical protein